MSRRTWCAPAAMLAIGLAALAMLHGLRHALPLPGTYGIGAWESWLRATRPSAAIFALARAAATALSSYVALLGALGLAASVSRTAALGRVAWRLACPSLRPLLAPVAALTITLSSALPAHAEGRGAPTPPVMQVASIDATSPPVMRLAAVMPTTPPPAPSDVTTHTVVAGDTFWSIAEGVLQASGRSTSDADVLPYWRALIDANRGSLRAPGQPDLIYPGQVFELPPLT